MDSLVDRKNRITLLSDAEIEELYGLPEFTDIDRDCFFALSNSEYELLDEYRTLKLKVYFIIQLGYFRATQRFYNFKLEDVSQDVSYLVNKYFDQPHNSLMNRPYREIIKAQQSVILKLHGYTDWSKSVATRITVHLLELVRYYPKVNSALYQTSSMIADGDNQDCRFFS